ncbi:MAG: Tm-1-like ATP-binding domain-containing protein [Hasllibacter sp.]
MSVLLLATYDTKAEEAAYLMGALMALGVAAERCDISLHAGGEHWDAARKMAGMDAAAARALDHVAFAPQQGRRMVVAIGGGTGGQIALKVMRALPIEMPKVMVSTLPFDPRYELADNAIILVPTMADLTGLNATVRQALDRAAAIVGGLYHATLPTGRVAVAPSTGITALGITAPGVDALSRRLKRQGRETTVFHANGFGGAAFARWCAAGAFDAVIDYTPHEVTRLHVAGVHTAMPARFDAYRDLPRVLLPGGVNVIGMGQDHLMPDVYRARPHYAHSPLFTHVQCTPEEIRKCAHVLAAALSDGAGPARVVLPMGGFSSEDREGASIHSAKLRAVFAEALEGALPPAVPVRRIDAHVNDPAAADAAAEALEEVRAQATLKENA